MFLKRIISYILFLFLSINLFAQPYSNIRFKSVATAKIIVLDSLSIVPKSVKITDKKGKIISDTLFNINYAKSTVFIHNLLIDKYKTLNFRYRVFPISFSATYPAMPYVPSKLNNFKILDTNNNFAVLNNDDYNTTDNITINGNITRGVSTGNSKNMTTFSNINLQINGELSEKVNIEAYLSDKNIPIQPDGYSQQIQDFDKIFVRLYSDSVFYLQMGDVNTRGSDSYFLRFNKNIMGGDMAYFYKKRGVQNTTQVSGAIAKGNYNRMKFNAIESVQGPYLLRGKNNESYIVVLAGSERIFLDGKLLKRGENNDYTINYNTAELTFTSKNMLTQNSRITAEFEYSNQNYNRFLVFAKNTIKNKKATFSLQFFNEQDAKNQPISTQLTDKQKQQLYNAGDNKLNAFVSNIDSVAFNKNMVLYKMIDTTVNSKTYDSVLVYSHNANEAFYKASFTNVGNNKGNYIIYNNIASGRVYKWIAPIGGVPQGNYQPIQMLIAPQKHQVAVASVNYKVAKNTNLYVETAVSDNDKNTFSPINANDNKGIAIKTQVKQQINLKHTNILLMGNYETASRYFKAIDRYKSVEFERDWNIQTATIGQEHLAEASVNFVNKKQKIGAYKIQYLNKNKSYEGIKNTISTDWQNKWFGIKGYSSLLKSNDKNTNTNSLFYRHLLELSRSVKKLNIAVNNSFEQNKLALTSSDSVLGKSKKFNQWEGKIFLPDTLSRYFSASYKHRTDFLPINNDFTPLANTQDVSLHINMAKSKISRLNALITWRELLLKNKKLNPNLNSETNFLTRIDHRLRLKKSWLTLFSFYETGTGMQARKEYVFLKVPIGQGVYVWIDYNKNNIPELNEFEVSAFPEEANYIRIYTPTNEYIKVYTIKINETLSIKPKKIWQNKNKIKGLIARFENTTALQMIKKHTQNSFANRINPFVNNIEDTMLINSSLRFRNTLSFNRNNPIFGVDWIFRKQKQKILFANGFNNSDLQINQMKIRWNINTYFLTLNTVSYEQKEFKSEHFAQKNYYINSVNNNFVLQWQPSVKFRLSVTYEVKQKTNTLANKEQSFIQKIYPQIKYSIPNKGIATLWVGLINVKANNLENQNIVYEILEGYQQGKNYQWKIGVDYNLNKYLRLSVNYSGRKSENINAIHVGQFGLSAVF